MLDKLNKILEKFNIINEKLMNSSGLSHIEIRNLSKERSELLSIVEIVEKKNICQKKIEDNEAFIKLEDDQEMKNLFEEEIRELKGIINKYDEELLILLIPKDEDDDRNAILEIGAGTGGEEAALFGGVLFRMYSRYAERRKWKFEVISISNTGLGGCKDATISISGKGVFGRMKFEAGVHRVQRVPETEASGRIHTSAATVAVLPEVEDVEVNIRDEDIRIDVYRASGAGGQHVNKTESAVRITHMPSGIVICQQDEKSQHKNKERAMKILRSKLYEMEKEKKNAEVSAMKKNQVGDGDRSGKIRTYNYPQSRITDHRINLTLHGLQHILDGDLDEIIDALLAAENASRLSENY